jgi:two-component system OmpR family sensor kinase
MDPTLDLPAPAPPGTGARPDATPAATTPAATPAAATVGRRVAAAAPLAVGLVAAVAVRLLAPSTDVYARTRMWIACAGAGLVVSAGLTALTWVRGRVARAHAEGRAEGQRAAAEDHRRFLMRLDHELKNPITAIQAGVANLANGTGPANPAGQDDPPGRADPSGPAGAATSVISAQTQRLANLVADLRKLAELETRPIERHPVDLAELLGEVREAIAELPDAADRTLTLALPRAPWPLGTVPGDRDLLFLALHNLVVNAVKFTRPGDTIEIRARDDGPDVVVEVADTGVGIPDEEVTHIWEELSRGSAATGTPGMGLGLALVRVVVARHGGQVSARSRLGHGTVIGVSLPAA